MNMVAGVLVGVEVLLLVVSLLVRTRRVFAGVFGLSVVVFLACWLVGWLGSVHW